MADENKTKEWYERQMAQFKAEIRAEMDVRLTRLEERLRADLATLRADLVKWMFIFWATTALGVIGLIKF